MKPIWIADDDQSIRFVLEKALAREHLAYCPDIVFQGSSDLAPLAAALMDSDWWFFWWD